MSEQPSIPTAQPVTEYVADGARIAGILLVWGVIAAFFAFGVGAIGSPGSLFPTVGQYIGAVFALTGVLNAILYLLYRAIDYWKRGE